MGLNIRGILWLVLSCCLQVQSSNDTNKAYSNRTELLLSTGLTIGRNGICVDYGELVYINCTLSVQNVNVSKITWRLSWHNGERRLRAVEFTKSIRNSSTFMATSELGVHANWSDIERTFRCTGEWSSENGGHSHDSSLYASIFVIRIKPKPINVISRLRFTETSRGGKMIEASWEPLDFGSASKTKYILKLCIEPDDEDVSLGCPNYSSAGKTECRFRNQTTDSSSVPPHTLGPTCRASFVLGYTALTDIQHRVYIESQRLGCETKGRVRTFYLDFSPDESNPYPNRTLYMVPHSVINLNVSTSRHRIVELSWSNPEFVYKTSRRYTLDYNCSTSDTVWSKNTSANQIRLHSVDFRPYIPYARCRFCVKATLYNHGVSESMCITARLHEEVPSSSPRIECETTNDGLERNVTVTWALPPPRDWNGVLEKVKLIYRVQGRNHRQVQEISETDLTKGVTVLKRLTTNNSYVIKMVACNKEGCSEPDNETFIPVMASTHAPSVIDRRESAVDINKMIIVGLVIGIVTCIIVIVACLAFVKSRRKKCSLPSLEEPNQYIDAEESSENDYDVV